MQPEAASKEGGVVWRYIKSGNVEVKVNLCVSRIRQTQVSDSLSLWNNPAIHMSVRSLG
jgi:hypothetical protein